MSFLDTINNIYGAFSSLVGGVGDSVSSGNNDATFDMRTNASLGNENALKPYANNLNNFLGVERDDNKEKVFSNYVGSPKQLEDLQRNFQEKQTANQARDLANARSYAANQVYSNYAMLGSNPYDDPLFQEAYDSALNMDSVPISYLPANADFKRRAGDGEGGIKPNPLDWNIMGFTSQEKTPSEAKDLYEYYFDKEAQIPKDEGSDYWEQNRGTWGLSSKNRMSTAAPMVVDMNWGAMGFNPYNDPLYQQQKETASTVPMQSVVDEDRIDNGISEKAHQSMYMTGNQYKRYREIGIPGRPIEDIVDSPDVIYSKQDEMENHGFIPYLEDQAAMDKFRDDASMNAVNNLYNGLADLRKNNTSYSFNYDGETYDGKDFVDKYTKWVNRTAFQEVEPYADPSRVTEYSVPLTWYIHDSVTGEDIYAPSSDGELVEDPETGMKMIDFHTGDPGDNWYFDAGENPGDAVKYAWAGNEHPVLGWADQEPLVLSSGQKVRADKAMDLYDHQEDYADYGTLDMGRPSPGDPRETGSWAPWFVDMALGSAPLFFGPTAGSQAVGNTYSNLEGFRPGVQNEDRTYNLLSEDPTRGQQLVTSTGSAILPSTERIWGIAAKNAMPGVKWLQRTRPDIAEHPLFVLGTHAGGEGLEEIPGNLVEEMQSSGSLFNDYFSDPLYYYYDDDKNKVYTTQEANPNNPDEKYIPALDKQGKRMVDPRTGFLGKVGNFMEEIPLSVLGGASLGGTLGVLDAARATKPYLERKKEREELGYNINIPDSVIEYTRRQAGE